MTTELQTTLNAEIETLLPTLKEDQLDYVLDHGKYMQVAEVDTDTMKYQVHEYVSPYGIGFTCIFKATEDGKDYVKTVGFGSGNGTHDWQEVIEDS